ncbi:S28 family serine protease [Myxococcus stipitatus]|uniref:S28 family serine protease n=1 Tax=Myxococcus stipitatus TaxID=83455 RepID=UPI0030D5C5A3
MEVESTNLEAPRQHATRPLTTGVGASEDILTQLQSIPGLTVLAEEPAPYPGTRFFKLSLEQPTDHLRPQGERFPLLMTLLHRSITAPMVLASTGYGSDDFYYEEEPTKLLEANQLAVGHRFFTPSRPASSNWKHLNIWQSANDSHRIVQAFKPLYPQRWLHTGASKGGMAAVYHRYFFPDDVDATVAYVAPNSYGVSDVRYVHFLNQVGDEACRAKLRGFQREVLIRREEVLSVMEQWAATKGLTFHQLGMDRAFEFSVLSGPFILWQFGGARACALTPPPGAPAADLFDFLVGISIPQGLSDTELPSIEPYYYQAATELGSFRPPTQHLSGLLRYPGQYTPAALVSFPITERFNHGLMRRVEHWVHHWGERMLFVYGANDPWSTGAFSVRERNDSFRFDVPGGNHRANITRLPEADRAVALERLFSWMDVSVPPTQLQSRLDEAALAPARSRPRHFPL